MFERLEEMKGLKQTIVIIKGVGLNVDERADPRPRASARISQQACIVGGEASSAFWTAVKMDNDEGGVEEVKGYVLRVPMSERRVSARWARSCWELSHSTLSADAQRTFH